MPYTPVDSYMKLTFGGSAWDQQEIWSFGIHLAMEDGSAIGSAFEDFDLDAAIIAYGTTMNVDTARSQSSSVSFDEVRLALFNNLSQQQGDSRVAFNTINNTGLDSSQYLPQGSVAVTTNSDILRGKTSKGRFYLPPGWYEIAQDGYIEPGILTDTVAQVSNFLNALADVALDADPQLRLVNVTAAVPTLPATTPAAANPIIYFTVGNVVDTQRRRRNGLNERYTRGNLTP